MESVSRKYSSVASLLKDNLDMILKGKLNEADMLGGSKRFDLNEMFFYYANKTIKFF